MIQIKINTNQNTHCIWQSVSCYVCLMQVATATLVTSMNATTTSPSLPWASDAPIWQKVWAFLKSSPVTALAVYTMLSLYFKENYPFSNYPMYSNPSAERPYYTVADGDGNPLPIQAKTGITCPKIGKIYRKKSEELGKKIGLRAKELPPQQVQVIGMEIFAQLRREAAKLKQPMPAKLQLTRTIISYENGKIVESPQVIAQEPAPVSL